MQSVLVQELKLHSLSEACVLKSLFKDIIIIIIIIKHLTVRSSTLELRGGLSISSVSPSTFLYTAFSSK